VIETAAQMADPASLLLVAGGSILTAALQSTGGDIARAVRSILPLLRSNPDRDALAARRAVRQLERIAELKGTSCADQVDTESRFVRTAALKLADTPSASTFSDWAEEELEARRARHGAAAAVWRAAADAAPNMGMIGTVLGLIGMFAALDDPARMGPAMALAMLTTFYGLVLGSLFFGPLAARLERLSEAELAWQKQALARIEALARAESSKAGKWLKRRNEAAE
jgi:chemotaxis protein MotA